MVLFIIRMGKILHTFFLFYSEIEQTLACIISDRATDEVLEALTRYQKGISISDSSYILSDTLTPDVIRRSSQVSH